WERTWTPLSRCLSVSAKSLYPRSRRGCPAPPPFSGSQPLWCVPKSQPHRLSPAPTYESPLPGGTVAPFAHLRRERNQKKPNPQVGKSQVEVGLGSVQTSITAHTCSKIWLLKPY